MNSYPQEYYPHYIPKNIPKNVLIMGPISTLW